MDIPKGVIACGPDGRIGQLPPEDIAEIEAFAALLTDDHPASYCTACRCIAVRPDQHQCTPKEDR